jgi:hypothetical protein
MSFLLTTDWDNIPAQPQPEDMPPPKFDTRPISKEEVIRRMEEFRYDSNFMRLPVPGFIFEEYPEYAESRQQLALIQSQFAEKVDKARLLGDIKMEEEALK